MRKTDNLKLNILDLKDRVSNTVFNENTEFLDKEVSNLIDKVNMLLNDPTKLKLKKVDALPEKGEEMIIYLVKDRNSNSDNTYLEYLWLDDKWDPLGSTKVNLVDYVKKVDLEEDLKHYAKNEDLIDLGNDLGTKLDKKVSEVDGKGLSTNDYDDVAKAKVDSIPSNPKYTDTIPDLSGYAKKDEIPKLPDLSGYAKTSDVKTKLSELESDSENRLVSDVEKTKLSNLKEQVILTETEYNALSTEQQNDESKIYFLKEG